MKTRLSALLLALAAMLVASTAAQAKPPYPHLNPGGLADLQEVVPVNFVFVGYEPELVDEASFLDQLADSYQPVVRSRLWYDVEETLGIHYRYDYSITYADAAYEDAFFGALAAMAEPAPLTLFQDEYNAQERNVLDVGDNHFIDAPSVEKWLIDNPPEGIDTRENTVFFVNWYGRPDFRFHVYTKFGEPDPDTGYDFGERRASRKIVAWGGTTPEDEETGLGERGVHRVWFHDLSAGPEWWSGSWNVDDADLDEDGEDDYRLPPVWEYLTPGGYRPASELAADLGRLARYGAVNLLFTTSPLYPPYITPNRQPASINLDLNTYEGLPGVDASEDFQTPDLLLEEVGEVHPIPYTVDEQDVEFEGKAAECYELFLLEEPEPCYPNRPYPGFANLFVHNALNIGAFWDGGAEYESLFFNYAVPEELSPPFLGFADDKWIDGTQSLTFNFVSPDIAEAGYGFTTTQIHEYGHHFGLSHPHDGYDSETGTDYGPEGEFFFVWAADEVNSMMSYIDLNWDYSQFDRDNVNRFQAAAYWINANAITADILASPGFEEAQETLLAADAEFGSAKEAMADHDYVATFDHAKLGHELVRTAADQAGVEVVASQNGWTVLPEVEEDGAEEKAARSYSFVDPVGRGTQRGQR